MSEVRRKLNQKQVAILHLIYRFRFVTTELTALYQGGKDAKTVYPRLQTLAEQGYIGRRYESHYRLEHRPAAYFLLPDGLRVLRSQPKEGYTYDEKALHNIRRDQTATDQFIARSLDVLHAYCLLREQYGDKLQFFTKNDLAAYDHFPRSLLDAYLRLEVGGETKQYFLTIHQQDVPFYLHVRRIKQYADYADAGTWEVTETRLPDILALCDTTLVQKRLTKRIAKENHPDLHFYLAAKDTLKNLAANTHIWHLADEPETAMSLEGE